MRLIFSNSLFSAIFARTIEGDMRKLIFLLLGSLLLTNLLMAQCDYAVDEIDPFDSTRLVALQPIDIGYKIPSQYTDEYGDLTMIDQGKALITYTENDSISGFFFTIALAERDYHSTKDGVQVGLLLSDERVIWLRNFPDNGEFDSDTNMRIYQHTCVMPLDTYYALTFQKIEMIRVAYPGYKKTLKLLPEQQEAIREAFRCIGEAVGLYPVKP
jgi:hypothetical protein